MLDLDDLRLIRALDQAGSLAGAARVLNVTPPAISTRLKRLEHGLGVSLVVRTARGALLTDEGHRLRDEALLLLDRLEAMSQTVRNSASALAGTLRIAAPYGFGRRHIAPLISSFQRRYPGITASLMLSENPTSEARAMDLTFHIGMTRDLSLVRHPMAREADGATARPRRCCAQAHCCACCRTGNWKMPLCWPWCPSARPLPRACALFSTMPARHWARRPGGHKTFCRIQAQAPGCA